MESICQFPVSTQSVNVSFRSGLLFCAMLSTACGAFGVGGGSPEDALVEILTATKPEVVERHLPESLLNELKTLDQAGRLQCEKKLLIGDQWRKNGTTLSVPEDGASLVVLDTGEKQVPVRVQREILGGDQALLEVAFEWGPSDLPSVIVWMRMEDGEWRVTEVQGLGSGEHLVLDGTFVEPFRDLGRQDREAPVINTLRTLGWALGDYARANPEIGYPVDLAVSASPSSADENSDGEENGAVSGLADPAIAQNDFTKDGYVFHYELRQAGADGDYSITARPAKFGKPGTTGFFVDSSGAIHETKEDREPTVADDVRTESPHMRY